MRSESPTPLQGSNSAEGKPLLSGADNILTSLDEYTYSLVVRHYGSNPDAPLFKVVIIDTIPQEKRDNSVVWVTFKEVTLLNLSHHASHCMASSPMEFKTHKQACACRFET